MASLLHQKCFEIVERDRPRFRLEKPCRFFEVRMLGFRGTEGCQHFYQLFARASAVYSPAPFVPGQLRVLPLFELLVVGQMSPVSYWFLSYSINDTAATVSSKTTARSGRRLIHRRFRSKNTMNELVDCHGSFLTDAFVARFDRAVTRVSTVTTS